eukprot:COSAG03_NODE_19269_length_340_cov_0.477178_1_plen_40_part_10
MEWMPAGDGAVLEAAAPRPICGLERESEREREERERERER